MEIVIIVAVDENNAIGSKGDQLAYISGDLKRFKQLTTGHSVIMGRKTFNALPGGALPNRRNIVISRDKKFEAPGCEIATSPMEAIELCKSEDTIFVIGGGEIYKLFMPLADKIYLTLIHHRYENTDTIFPKIEPENWIEESSTEALRDEKSGICYSYKTFIKAGR